jgi:Protein of unknown function (DUF1360)
MAEQRNRPLVAYATLASAFGTGFGSFVAWRRSQGGLPERIDPVDVILMGIATHKLSRTVTKDKVASFVRAPFAEPNADGSLPGEVEDRARGEGLRAAVGQLLTCPHCFSMWAAAGLSAGLVTAPRETRLIAATLSSVTLSDFLSAAYRRSAQMGDDEDDPDAAGSGGERQFAPTPVG